MPLTTGRSEACCCGGMGTSMNLGLSGPIAGRDDVVVKVRIGSDLVIVLQLHRASELIELWCIDGGIAEVVQWCLRLSLEAHKSPFSSLS